MTPEEIRAEYKRRTGNIKRLNGDIAIERAYINVLQTFCEHPEAYQYSAMGELGTKCPDCGYAT